MNWYLQVLKNYANFKGRARRKELWMFVLFNVIFAIAATILDNKVLGITFDMNGQSVGYGWIYLIYCLAVFIPGLAVEVRRLHDIGKSGWNLLLALIPLVGAIILLVWFCKDSQPGENKWGKNPKE
ncbi:MAG: DUF805 domain-containing protein [Prevotellaceae bacterium]|jgi:uncharacterized membrane protein YhaH (DUF805 family)|nr:DUF805 domain-containing protein [Prevotellaceae bacterium]